MKLTTFIKINGLNRRTKRQIIQIRWGINILWQTPGDQMSYLNIVQK